MAVAHADVQHDCLQGFPTARRRNFERARAVLGRLGRVSGAEAVAADCPAIQADALAKTFEYLAVVVTGQGAVHEAHLAERAVARRAENREQHPAPRSSEFRDKTDAAHAEAICEAVARPNMRFVPTKTREQQGVLVLHRARSLLVRQRTAAVNAARGLLGEFGMVAGKGIRRVEELRRRMGELGQDVFPDEARQAVACLFDHIDALQERVAAVEARILAWHKGSEESRRLASVPGVGPMMVSALVAAVCDGRQFRSARHFAAWLGLTPRIQASDGRERIGRISKGGDRYLRTLLIHGARAVVGTTFRKDVAHKTARALWAMLTRAEAYRRPAAAAA